MEGKRQRQRIAIKSKERIEVVYDPLAYTVNKSSLTARAIDNKLEHVNIDLWFDKHYEDRCQFGDDDGKRDGIDKAAVKTLVLEAAKYLIYFSCVCPGFTFVNRLDPKQSLTPVRVICRKQIDAGMLNVAIEGHFLEINKFEITVVTAMCIDSFRVTDNQYVIELTEEGATLFRMVNKNLREVCNT